jgi:ribosomal-protein-alanine N-acetyltransferase
MYYTCETERLILKILNKDAAPMVLDLYKENKASFECWEPKRPTNFYTLNYQKASLSIEAHQMSEGKLLRYWIFLKNNQKKIIGSVCFHDFLMSPYLCCSLGYKLDHKYVHYGYAYESIKKAIDIIWQDYHIHRIEAFIMPNNKPSLRLIIRLHFIYEGITYSYACINGKWTDHKRYAIINPSPVFL